MKVTAYIREHKGKNYSSALGTVYFRIRDIGKDFRVASELTIHPNHWSAEREGYKDRISTIAPEEKKAFDEKVHELKQFIIDGYKEDSDKEWLAKMIDVFHHPEKYGHEFIRELTGKTPNVKDGKTFQELFDEFLEKHSLSETRKKNFRVVKRALSRYELFIRKTKKDARDFVLDINTVDEKILGSIWDFMEKEYIYAEKYPKIYDIIPEKRAPLPRGKNSLIDSFSRLRTFFLWCFNQGLTTNRPFDKFPIEECLYGTPIYINLQERDQLYAADLSEYPKIAIQRDIFIFQSVVGCRIGDLYNLTRKNIVNGMLEYIQLKTKGHNPRTIRVPLNKIALEILKRYEDDSRKTILPFISEQKYNIYIKKAFKLAGLDRIVTILNPLTREPEQKPLYEVASSHTARKTFIGNMYKKVKDPDLVSSVSGHKEGSKAFRRYREIDDEMKKDLLSLLE